MKKLLLVALVAAMVAGTAEARRRNCGSRNECAPKCERVCKEKSSCIGAPRIVECTYNNECVNGPIPQVCYLVPAPRNVTKHIDTLTTTTYSCAPKPSCAVNANEAQIDELINAGHIDKAFTCDHHSIND